MFFERVTERRHKHLLIGVVAAACALRLSMPSRFPIIEADEGLWTRSGKNFVLFGDWFLDKHTHLFLSPFFHALTVVAFWAVSPSITVARIVSGVAGSVSIALLYALVRRLEKNRDLALTAAIVMAASAWSILISRRALVESVELSGMLLCAVLLTSNSRWAAWAAGAAFGIALLTKVNAAFIGPSCVLAILFGQSGLTEFKWPTHTRWKRAVLFVASATVIAGGVYLALYSYHPREFVQAFRFELDGVHFQGGSHPIVRLGRFGIDPSQEAHTMLRLFAIEPLLLPLAFIGFLITAKHWNRAPILFSSWLIIGMAYFLGQMYQPERYFYLLFPPLAYYAALALTVPIQAPRWQPWSPRLRRAALALFVLLDLAHVARNAIAGGGQLFAPAVQWAQRSTRPEDRVLASALLCTDLPNRTYAFYRLVDKASDLPSAINRLHIRYVIVDDFEWPADYRNAIAGRYTVLQKWPHAVLYRVGTPSSG